MKKYFALFCLAALALAGCNREELAPSTPSLTGKTVLTLSIPETKTTMGELSGTERPVYWANGDKVAVNGVVSEPLAELPANSRSAEFIVNDVITPPFKAVYPETLWKDENTVTLPQATKSGILPLAGYGDMETMSVKPLTAGLHLTIKKGTDEDKIKLLQITSDGARLSGDFAIDFSTGELTPAAAPTDAEKTIVLDKTFYPTEEGYEVFLPVPAGTYGFTLKLMDVQGHYMEVPTTAAKTFVAGEIKSLPAVTFAPTGTTIDIEIRNAQDLVDFATAWNAETLGLESPIVHVLADITFDATTAAAFTATGGIGTDPEGDATNYFNGLFEGNSHSISGYHGSVPLFAYTGGGAIIQNLNISSDYSVTADAGATGIWGVLVGRNKATIKNCTSLANLIIKNIDVASTQNYGGLVGRNYGGTIETCSVGGNITCPVQGTAANGYGMRLGGIAGYLEEGGKIKDCSFSGTISLSDDTEFGGLVTFIAATETTSALTQYVNLGGIVGTISRGTVISCEVTAGSAIDVRGIVSTRVGGIAGMNENNEANCISDCVNRAALSFASDGERGQTTGTYYGGIAGQNRARIEDCTNYGPISTVCNSTTISIAGIAGTNLASISGCINEETGTVTRTSQVVNGQTNRYICIGGIVAETHAATDPITIESCSNKAKLVNNQPGPQALTTIRMGGIVAGNDKTTVMTIKSCDNSGEITTEDKSGEVANYLTAVGGIVGATSAAIRLEDCHNTGRVALTYSKKNSSRDAFLGGIVGLICKYKAAEGKAGLVNTVGIPDVVIKDCTHKTGGIANSDFSNGTDLEKSPFTGGIIGALKGDATSRASITGCSVSECTLYEHRGYLGGLAGYLENTDVTSCTVSFVAPKSNENALYSGGLVGWTVASSLQDCMATMTFRNVKNMGGLVAVMDKDSVLSACKAKDIDLKHGTASDATDPATLVSIAEAGATITNCGVSGTIDGTAITLESTKITQDSGALVSGTYLLE